LVSQNANRLPASGTSETIRPIDILIEALRECFREVKERIDVSPA
jgi:hypothetical protein